LAQQKSGCPEFPELSSGKADPLTPGNPDDINKSPDRATMTFLDSDIFRWVVIPLLIFTARIMDVSLQTMRIIFVSKGRKLLAPLLGFFEVMIWLMAIAQIMHNMTNPLYYLAYGLGFAMGTYVGLGIEERLAIGIALLRVITQRDATQLVAHLRGEEFGVTCVDAEGKSGKVKLIFIIVNRGDLPRIIDLIREYNPNAFYSIEDVRSVSRGFFPAKNGQRKWFKKKRFPVGRENGCPINVDQEARGKLEGK
jgi:uncharacterized protein YebE (UPF0316 family)